MRHLATTTGVNGLLLLFGMLTSTLAARLLGPQGRGELAAVQNFIGLLYLLALIGLPDALTYSTGRYKRESRQSLVTAVLVALSLAVPIALVGSAVMGEVLGRQREAIVSVGRICLLSIPLLIVAGLPFNCLQGLLQMRLWNGLRLVGPALWLSTLAACWWMRPTGFIAAEDVLRVHLGAYMLNAVIIFFMTRTSLEGPYRFSFTAARRLTRYGSAVLLSAAPQELNQKFDQLLMAAWLPPTMLGKYAVAVAWSNLVPSMTQAAGQIGFPSLANSESLERKQAIGTRITRCSIAAGCTIAVAWGAASLLLFPVVLGAAFSDALHTLAVLIPAAAVSSVSSVSSQILKGLGRPRDVMFAELWGLLGTVIFLMLLLERYQLVGASIASLASYSMSLAVGVRNLKRALGVSFRDLLIPSLDDWLLPIRVATQVLQNLRDKVASPAPSARRP